MLYNFTFLLSSLFFFFLKIWSEIGIRIIHGPALYTGKYGNLVRGKLMSPTPTLQETGCPIREDETM